MSHVGIVALATYIPEQFISANEIAEHTKLPQQIVEDKLGIKRKPIPGEDDHPCEMGIKAARKAMSQAGLDPEAIDVVIYIGEEYKEYPIWTAGIKLQKEIGATKAWAFDTALRCGTAILGMKLAKSLLLSDPSIHTVLLAGGYRNGDLVSYDNASTRFLFNLAAGGGAIILQSDVSKNLLLGSYIMTDGRFTEDVIIEKGGTRHPLKTGEYISSQPTFHVTDPEGMKTRLEEVSMKNFIYCIEQALKRSELSISDINYLAILHMKKSAHQYVLKELGLKEEQSIYLENYGHIGQFDQILSLELALAEEKVKPGDVVVFVSAGIGYAWGANVIRWGERGGE